MHNNVSTRQTGLNYQDSSYDNHNELCQNELIVLVKQGNMQAYRRLYDMHISKVYSLAYRLTADASLAEDATQEVFIQLWQKIHTFNGQSAFSTWLYSVTSNITISYMRKQKGWISRIFSIADHATVEPFTQNETMSLDECIIKLPEQTRLVFVLYAVQGLRHEEVAKQLHIAVGTSKAQFHRAKQLLQEWLDASV